MLLRQLSTFVLKINKTDNMTLFDTISEDIKKAMLAKDRVRLDALRSVKKEFIEAKTAKGTGEEFAEEKAISILQKMVKQRKESAEIYSEQNREELAEAEIAQMKIIQEYLPAQLSNEEIEAAVKKIIVEAEASTMKDMGKVMAIATKELAGKADGIYAGIRFLNILVNTNKRFKLLFVEFFNPVILTSSFF